MKADEQKNSPIRKGWIGLLTGLVLIAVFLFWLGPWLERLPLFQPLVRLIDEQDIDAGAYYYTDIEEFADAEFNIRQAMTYAPGKTR